MDVIEPESEGQRAKLLPILEETGQHIQETKANARTDILLHYRELEAALLPILSQEQANRLQSWREKLRVTGTSKPLTELARKIKGSIRRTLMARLFIRTLSHLFAVFFLDFEKLIHLMVV